MIPLSAAGIAALCGGKYIGKHPDHICGEIVTDSRKLTENCVFVALRGERFDGHDFAAAALEKAAVAVVSELSCVEDALKSGERGAILVPDTLKALGNLAASYLAKYFPAMKRAAVTGSVGKTSTKEMCAHVLSSAYRTARTPENFNNEIGLPMTALGLPADTELFVAEMGMRGLGQISYLTRIVMPSAAVITNIGNSHLELLGTRENILRAKTEIVTPGAPLSEDEPFILAVNGDNDLLSDRDRLLKLAAGYGRDNIRIVTFGTGSGNDYRAEDAVLDADGSEYVLVCGEGRFRVKLNVPGEHSIYNSLAAAALASAFGVSAAQAAEALSTYGSGSGAQPLRQRREKLAGGRLILMDDTYNAGPESVAASLKVMSAIPADVHIAALADMLELGEGTRAFHENAGGLAAERCDRLYFAGDLAESYLSGAEKYAEAAGKRVPAECFADSVSAADSVCAGIAEALGQGKTAAVLVKGSHATHMERISAKIRDRFGAPEAAGAQETEK